MLLGSRILANSMHVVICLLANAADGREAGGHDSCATSLQRPFATHQDMIACSGCSNQQETDFLAGLQGNWGNALLEYGQLKADLRDQVAGTLWETLQQQESLQDASENLRSDAIDLLRLAGAFWNFASWCRAEWNSSNTHTQHKFEKQMKDVFILFVSWHDSWSGSS